MEGTSIKGVSPSCQQNMCNWSLVGETACRTGEVGCAHPGEAAELGSPGWADWKWCTCCQLLHCPHCPHCPCCLHCPHCPRCLHCLRTRWHDSPLAAPPPGGGRSGADRKGAKLRQHLLDMPGSVFWDGKVRWLSKWKRDDTLLKRHVLALQARRVTERWGDARCV